MSTSHFSNHDEMAVTDPAVETTDELLARLPPLPKLSKPFFGSKEHLLANVSDAGDVAAITEMASGRYLDDLLIEVFAALPDVALRAGEVGPAGVRLQSRPSNSINALTVPTSDGVIIVYNLGLFGLLFSVAVAVSLEARAAENAVGETSWSVSAATVDWLSLLIDWATSLAAEPRHGPVVAPDRDVTVDDDLSSRATAMATPGQLFALCHELGHVLALSEEKASLTTAPATVHGVQVDAVVTSRERELAADATGLDLLVDVLSHEGKNPVGALIGMELFLNTVGMMQPFAAESGEVSHPHPDDRLHNLRMRYFKRFEGLNPDVGAAIAVRALLEALRSAVVPAVTERRRRVHLALEQDVAAYLAQVETLDKEAKRQAARSLVGNLLSSPGATLLFLRAGLTAPRGQDEPDGGSPTRLLLYNAALHLEAPLRAAIGLRA
ncbi:MAG: hypothetical protein JWM76_4470 [Pseudonocardiales bacterium]|nr:hypothetical protein [Pseudonocardiales bacterium]